MFNNIYQLLKLELDKDGENPVTLYYLCLASLLIKKTMVAKQATRLFRTMYTLDHENLRSKSIVVEYYLVKIKNLEKLIQNLPRIT